MSRIWQAIKRLDFRDALAVGGIAGICGGAWMIYPPAAFIAFGVACSALWWTGRR